MKLEPLTDQTVQMLARSLGSVQSMILNLGEADTQRGAARLSDNKKCLWTKDGRRITLTMISDGGFVGSCSKDPDPEAPARTK